MKNLAVDKDCDGPIELELTRCGIEIVWNQPRDGEVPSSLRGALGKFSFRRAWYYWMVSGKVPLAMANELYGDPVGRTDIRVNGHCGCPAPGEPGGHIVWRDRETGKILMTRESWSEVKSLIESNPRIAISTDGYLPSDDPTEGEGFIESYHIDTEVGLRIFADTLKKYKLV